MLLDACVLTFGLSSDFVHDRSGSLAVLGNFKDINIATFDLTFSVLNVESLSF